PLLRRDGGVREGGARRRSRAGHRGEPRPRAGRAPSAPDALVPEQLGVGRARTRAPDAPRGAPRGRPRDDRGRSPVARPPVAVLRRRARAPLHRERHERRAPLGTPEREPVRQGRQPPPPPERWRGRNHEWLHLYNEDVISMPDTWEYPWYAAWDLAFHMIPLALVDPDFAKAQLVLFLREWYMHPNGQMPAYEWALG